MKRRRVVWDRGEPLPSGSDVIRFARLLIRGCGIARGARLAGISKCTLARGAKRPDMMEDRTRCAIVTAGRKVKAHAERLQFEASEATRREMAQRCGSCARPFAFGAAAMRAECLKCGRGLSAAGEVVQEASHLRLTLRRKRSQKGGAAHGA